MIILGVDPSLRGTGFGIIEGAGQRWRCRGYGVISNPAKLRTTECLVSIHHTMLRVAEEFRPDVCAIEGVFYMQNAKIAITMGHARGAILAAVASRNIPVFEYAPRRVKQSVSGHGGAGKNQVASLVRAVLEMTETPPPDAADALAIALTHSNQLIGIQTGQLKQL